MTTANPVTVEYSITRALAAGPERAYRAWTDADEIAAWFHPAGLTSPRSGVSLDVRVGGAWSVLLTDAEGNTYPLNGFYRALDAPTSLVFTTGDPDNTTGDLASTVTVTFTATVGGSEMVFHQAGVNTPPEHAEQAKAGWVSFFDNLDAHLAA